MNYEHIVIYLKANGQLNAARSLSVRWEELNEQVARWKKEFPDESNKCLVKVWGDSTRKKIPILFGKKGRLELIPINRNSPNKKLLTLPKNSFEIIPNGFFVRFSHTIADDTQLLGAYREWTIYESMIKSALLDVKPTFKHEGTIKEMKELFSSYSDVKKEVTSWHQENKASIIPGNKHAARLEQAKTMVSNYQKHFSECVVNDVVLKEKDSKLIMCANCKSQWEFDEKKKKLSLLKLIKTEMTFLRSATQKFEQIKEMIPILLEKGKAIQKTCNHIDLNKTQKLLTEYNGLLKECRKENFQDSELEAIMKPLKALIKAVHILSYQLDDKLINNYNIEQLNVEIEGILEEKDNSFVPRTKKEFERQIKEWESTLVKEKMNWEHYLKNIIKELPSSYKFNEILLTAVEVKICLLAVQKLEGNYGYHLVADTLKGSKQKKVNEFNLQRHSFYGSLSRLKKDDLLTVLHACEKRDWIVQKGYDYPKIHITKKGLEQIHRLTQKELTKDDSSIQKEKEEYLSQNMNDYSSSLETVISFEEWKTEYLEQIYIDDGIGIYKLILQSYKEMKSQNIILETFLETHYEEKYKPIYQFYEKNVKSGHFSSLIQRVLKEYSVTVTSKK